MVCGRQDAAGEAAAEPGAARAGPAANQERPAASSDAPIRPVDPAAMCLSVPRRPDRFPEYRYRAIVTFCSMNRRPRVDVLSAWGFTIISRRDIGS